MNKNKLIAIKPKTKEELERLKLCPDESYNSLLERILPKWAQVLKSKLNEEASKEAPKTNETDNSS